MKHLKTCKLFENLEDNYLDSIYNRITDNDGSKSTEIVIAGSFRFYLEANYPKKVEEYFYRVSDGEDIVKVIMDISKNMTRNGQVGEYLRSMIGDIFPKYIVTCIANPEGFDLDIGNEYAIVDEYIDNGRELVELEYNASGEPYTIYEKNLFS
jgi:hypothetical protein